MEKLLPRGSPGRGGLGGVHTLHRPRRGLRRRQRGPGSDLAPGSVPGAAAEESPAPLLGEKLRGGETQWAAAPSSRREAPGSLSPPPAPALSETGK